MSHWRYYCLSAALTALLVLLYCATSHVSRQLAPDGWLFYAAGAALQGLLFAAIPAALFGWLLPCAAAWIAAQTIIEVFLLIDLVIFRLYNFHVGAALINLLLDERAGQVFVIDTALIAKTALVAAALALANVALFRLCQRAGRPTIHPKRWIVAAAMLALAVNIYHIVVAARATGRGFRPANERAIMRSYDVLPLFYPLRVNGLLERLGLRELEPSDQLTISLGDQLLLPPLDSLERHETPLSRTRPNILVLLVDCLRADCLNDSVTPHLAGLADSSTTATDHRSAGCQTTGGVIGLFFGLPPFYAPQLIAHQRHPLLLDALVERGYNVQTFPSASIALPNFNEVVFGGVPGGVRTDTPGETSIDRDRQISADLCQFLDHADHDEPFFAFAFFDCPHNYELPPTQYLRFQPSWTYADFLALGYDTDPEPFFNLYRNDLHYVDALCDSALRHLREAGLDERTIVIATGDHGQEFNDCANNLWCHGSALTAAQTAVPLVYHVPGQAPRALRHRTSHFDVAATLLRDACGIDHDPADYCLGHHLDDPAPRPWRCLASSKRADDCFEWTRVGDFVAFDIHPDTTLVLSDNGPVLVDRAFEEMNAPIDSATLANTLDEVQRFAPPRELQGKRDKR